MNFQEDAEQNRLYSGIKKGITYIEQVTYIVQGTHILIKI